MSLIVDIKKNLKGFSLNSTLEIHGGYTGLLGASGCGKSMTLKCIAGVETPDEGKIVLNDKVLFDSANGINLKPQERNIGYLFQNYALFPHMTVEENIGIGLKLPKNEKKHKTEEIINSFHLHGLEKKYPGQISGGQQQRVALARCIVYKPDMLLLDEPFSALDSHLKEQLLTNISDLLKLYEGEVFMVSHSKDEIYRFCEKLIVIDNGRCVLSGATKEIFEEPKLYSAAKLIGINNISRCEISSSDSIHTLDWGINLKVGKPISDKINYAGIRSKNLQVLDSAEVDNNNNNIFEFKIVNVEEDIFEYNIYLKHKENTSEDNSSRLLYKISKEIWENRENKDSLYIKIPESSILLLE